jgi:hypothetical protein
MPQQSVTPNFAHSVLCVLYDFQNKRRLLNSFNQFIFVMETHGSFFEVNTQYINIIYKIFSFTELNKQFFLNRI